MKQFLPILVFVGLYLTVKLGLAAPVDYISTEGSRAAWEIGTVELLNAIRKDPPFSEFHVVNARVVAWSVKKEDSDRPPGLLEEVLLLLRLDNSVDNSSSNLWVLAYFQRDLARGAIMSSEWTPGPTGKGMTWKCSMTHEPTESNLADFLRQSNFGNNECMSGIIPLHITLYAPFKSLRRELAKGISNSERERRFRGLDDIIWDPFPLR